MRDSDELLASANALPTGSRRYSRLETCATNLRRAGGARPTQLLRARTPALRKHSTGRGARAQCCAVSHVVSRRKFVSELLAASSAVMAAPALMRRSQAAPAIGD